MKITPTQARQVLTGTKTRHRIQAKTQRPPTRPGRTTQLAPGLTARVRVLDAQWITADWTDNTSLRAEGFKNPVDLKLDWLERYDAKWLEKLEQAGKDTDREILDRFAKRWASTPAWLLTIEPIATERHLLPAARPAGTTLGYTGRTIQDHPGPASRSIDPLDAGEAVDSDTLDRFARESRERVDLGTLDVRLRQLLRAQEEGHDVSRPLASIERRIVAAERALHRRAA